MISGWVQKVTEHHGTGWVASTPTTLLADFGEVLSRFCLSEIGIRVKFHSKYGSGNLISKFVQRRNLLVRESKWRIWTSQVHRKDLSHVIGKKWNISSVNRFLFYSFWRRNMAKLPNKLLWKLQDHLKKNIKNREIYVWKLLVSNIRKNFSIKVSGLCYSAPQWATQLQISSCSSISLLQTTSSGSGLGRSRRVGKSLWFWSQSSSLQHSTDCLIRWRNRQFVVKYDIVLWKWPTFDAFNGYWSVRSFAQGQKTSKFSIFCQGPIGYPFGQISRCGFLSHVLDLIQLVKKLKTGENDIRHRRTWRPKSFECQRLTL